MPVKRSIVKVYLLGIITLGIYFLYWLVKTKNELNELGAEIPTAWLIIIPIVNIYWYYKYAEGFAKVTKKESAILWFLLFFFVGIIMPAIVQSELNKLAK
jgi:membrane protease YdiL (CAAX protease family)